MKREMIKKKEGGGDILTMCRVSMMKKAEGNQGVFLFFILLCFVQQQISSINKSPTSAGTFEIFD